MHRRPLQHCRLLAILLVATLAASYRLHAAETDQFLVWNVTLRDSAPALNAYLNEEAARFLAQENALYGAAHTAAQVTQDLYLYLFRSLLDSRLRHYLLTANDIDRYPPSTVSYPGHLEMSIYSAKSFPFILPMARTIRVGDVYLGIDKLSHFFGFGRRYQKRYLRFREDGLSEELAMQKTVEWGMWCERYLVGNLTDGVYSYADLEANFQGMMMARAFSEGPDPLLTEQDGHWVLSRAIDIRPFITPDFDESFNRSRYMGTRKHQVLQVLETEICPKATLPCVQERFARYQLQEPSFSQRYIEQSLAKKGIPLPSEGDLALWCASCREDDSAKPVASGSPKPTAKGTSNPPFAP